MSLEGPQIPKPPDVMTLSRALQQAFIEAGNPSLRTVSDAGTRVSRQRLSDWRSGRHVPAKFSDLEPVLTYLRLAADSHLATDTASADAVSSGADDRSNCDRVTRWPLEKWLLTWQRATETTPPHTIAATSPIAPASSVGPVDDHESTGGDRDLQDEGAGHRRPLAIAVIALLVTLVAALAVAAYVISSLTL